MSGWTDERIEYLRKLWSDGFSASECAAKIGGGISRCAVIGKVNRLGIAARAKGAIGRPKKPETAVRPAPAPAPVPKPAAPPVKRIGVQYTPRPDPVVKLPLPTTGRVTLDELRLQHCRFIIGDPRDESHRYCGEEAPVGKVYCTAHAQLCYVPAPKRDKQRSFYRP